ncbi:MAG: DUF1579 domain-containing protein [Phycisphaerae bacterium]|nr:DUF1579 domain-containing protein [Phycisphaerae bacterium]
MNCQKVILPVCLSVVGLLAVAGSLAAGDPTKDIKPAGQPAGEMQLPPGWTPQDMQACMAAATPGAQHQMLAAGAGNWSGKSQMWMAPGTPAIDTANTCTVTPIMDGRYVKTEFTGDMPGMGPFTGFGINGFDNVSKKFVATWIDNMGTGIMNGTGEVSSDGKVITWTFSVNCPITGKPTTLREIETITGPNTKTLEMWGIDPKSGKEFKSMFIELTRQPA